MNYELESQVWKTARRSMSLDDFRHVVENAIADYRLPPGYFEMERIHLVDVGNGGLEVLRFGLKLYGLLHPNDLPTFVSLRMPLRVHLFAELRRCLVHGSHASATMIDGHFAGDLGL